MRGNGMGEGGSKGGGVTSKLRLMLYLHPPISLICEMRDNVVQSVRSSFMVVITMVIRPGGAAGSRRVDRVVCVVVWCRGVLRLGER